MNELKRATTSFRDIRESQSYFLLEWERVAVNSKWRKRPFKKTWHILRMARKPVVVA